VWSRGMRGVLGGHEPWSDELVRARRNDALPPYEARAFSKSRYCHPEQLLRASQRGKWWPAKGPDYT